ncbi:MAG: sodium/solute symporter [Blastocatellales bacterium]
MKRHIKSAPVLLFLIIVSHLSPAQAQERADRVRFERIAELPQPSGGQMAGVSNNVLLVIGGSHFDVPVWEGGTKLWHNTIHALDAGKWKLAGRLAHPLAYGGAVTVDDGVIVLGGSDGNRHYADVFRLRYSNGRLETSVLPALPGSLANFGVALLGRTIYVVGGQDSPVSTRAKRALRALDLSHPDPQWKTLDPIPGPARILPVVSAQDGAIYVFSGAELSAGPDGNATRRYLTDGWRYRPGRGWSRTSDSPRPIVAAPAIARGQSHILVFGGDDGRNALRTRELRDRHPGFSRDVLAYHTITDSWTTIGSMPLSLVTTAAVDWQSAVVIPGGEDRPAHRSPAVFAVRLNSEKTGFGFLNYTVLGLYLLATLLIGFRFSGKGKTTDDFFLGGRRVPWWAAGLSIYGTQLSAITYLAIPAKAYAEDWTYVLVNLTILIVAPIVVSFYLPFFRRLNFTTAYEYLEKRFNLTVRLLGSASFIILQTGRLAIVLFLPSLALSAVSGINIYLCILLMGLLTTIYTMEGGIEAVVWTDVVQVFVLLGGALISLVLLINGVDGGLSQVIDIGRAAEKFRMFNWTWDYTTTAVWVVVAGNIATTLIPYTTDQSVVQKYLTTSDERQAASGIWTNAVLTIPTALIFFGAGTALYAFYRTHPGLLDPGVPTDATFAWFIADRLPPGVAGLVVAGVFAAAMSTLSSSMNSIATAVVTDFYARFNSRATDARKMVLARRLTMLLGLVGTMVALLMATFEIKSLWDLFLQVLGLFGGGLAGVFMLGIFTRRAHGKGAVLGVIAGAIVLFLVQRYTRIHFFLYAATGIVTCLAVGYAASLLIPSARKSLEGLTIYTIGSRPKADETVTDPHRSRPI